MCCVYAVFFKRGNVIMRKKLGFGVGGFFFQNVPVSVRRYRMPRKWFLTTEFTYACVCACWVRRKKKGGKKKRYHRKGRKYLLRRFERMTPNDAATLGHPSPMGKIKIVQKLKWAIQFSYVLFWIKGVLRVRSHGATHDTAQRRTIHKQRHTCTVQTSSNSRPRGGDKE